MDQKNIIDYYNDSAWLYKYFCYNQKSLGMHFGFWNKNTKTRQDSIIEENNAIIKIAKIKKGMKVLDAGCGVGGTTLYTAKTTGATVWGISITPSQISLAKKLARKRHLDNVTHFSVQDYTKTKFENNFFDVVLGIESICYAYPKKTFLKESFRILKPGGKLIIADGYLQREIRNEKEEKIIKDFNWAFVLPEFITGTKMTQYIKQSGFAQVKKFNMIKEAMPSIEYFVKLAKRVKAICIATKYIPFPKIQAIYKNYIALKTAGEGYSSGLAGYYIHTALKPLK